MQTFNKNKCRIDPSDPHNQEKLFEIAYEYCEKRELEVLGMWYDNNQENKLIRFNLHIKCELPLEYFLILFDKWKLGIGIFWVDYIEDPATWRVYASRNEVMSTGSPYVCKHVVFGHFKYYLDSLRGEKTSREIADHIAGYVLQSEAYQTSRVDRFFLSNHFRICSDGDTQAMMNLNLHLII